MSRKNLFYAAKALGAAGLSDYVIADRLDLPRSTVQHWRRRATAPTSARPDEPQHFSPDQVDPVSYAYLLGIYLGDGNIWSTGPRTWRLAITCDAKYEAIIREVVDAVGAVVGADAVRVNSKGPGAKVVLASSALWPQVFPQHGAGKKHERRIVLEPWQRAITERSPRALIRGLIHSDGSRARNRFRTTLKSGRVARHEYVRYFFTNSSADIRRILCEHCDLVGVRWTQSNPTNVSVAGRASVRVLDAFVGAKR